MSPAPGRSRRRTGARLAVAGGLTLVALAALTVAPASAMGSGRLELRRAVLDLVGTRPDGDAPDAAMALGALRRAGAPDARLRAAGRPASALGVIAAVCAVRQPAFDDPEVVPGDLTLSMVAGAPRLGIAVSAADVATVDAAGTVAVVPLRALAGDDRAPRLVRAGALLEVCRPDPGVVAGADDTAAGSGGAHVALGSAGGLVTHLEAAAATPRDGEASPLHELRHGLGAAVGSASAAIGWAAGHVVDGVDRVVGLLGWRGVAVAPLLAVWALSRAARTTLDLRGAHAALVAATAVGMLLSPLGWLATTVGAVTLAAGAVTGRWSARGVVAGVRVAAWTIAGVVVPLVTGIDDSGRTSALVVVAAVATDALLPAKPLGLGRLGLWIGGEGGGAVTAAARPLSDLGNAASLQPSTFIELLAPARGGALSSLRRALDRGVDLCTIPLRGWSNAFSDSLALSRHLAGHGESLHGITGAGGAVGAADAIAARVAEVAPLLRLLDEGNSLHSVGRTLTRLAAGQGPSPWTPPGLGDVDAEWSRVVARLHETDSHR